MSGLAQDLRQALRQLRLSPGFAALAILTLALAIGANTAMFTVAEDVLLRPLPYSNAGRLISISPDKDSSHGSTSWLNYRDIRDQATRTFANIAVYSEDVGVIEGSTAGSDIAPTSVVTPNLSVNIFTMLGSPPLLGRTFTKEEGEPNGPKVALLSEGLWREQFHADPAVIGRIVRVNGPPRTVVGVMPASFRFPESIGPDLRKGLWLPLQPSGLMLSERGYSFNEILGQLRPGITIEQAQAELDRTTRSMRAANPTKL